MLIFSWIESLLFILVHFYDDWVYTPLQLTITPYVRKVPRTIILPIPTFLSQFFSSSSLQMTVFNANIVSYSRTILVLPIVYFLKHHLFSLASILVLFHDFLDHLDGIVAKVQRSMGFNDDPLFGSFIDAFCDKIVNCSILWTLIVLTNYEQMSWAHTFVFVSACGLVIAFEAALGVVRIQDYFYSKYVTNEDCSSSARKLEANLQGKLKEKLESLSLAFLCLAHSNQISPLDHWAGKIALICMVITLHLAHLSLKYKLDARQEEKSEKSSPPSSRAPEDQKQPKKPSGEEKKTSKNSENKSETKNSVELLDKFHVNSIAPPPPIPLLSASLMDKFKTLPIISSGLGGLTHNKHLKRQIEPKVSKVFTVGCFDLFHRGHIILMARLREIGHQVIVGVHDDASIIKLKNRTPIDNTETRVKNVKKYADVVFVIPSTDPTPYLLASVHLEKGETAKYVRGDDMPNFPGRAAIEQLMPIKFLPYTQGISSTLLRKELLKNEA